MDTLGRKQSLDNQEDEPEGASKRTCAAGLQPAFVMGKEVARVHA